MNIKKIKQKYIIWIMIGTAAICIAVILSVTVVPKIMARNPPISFYGRIIDQDELGVSNMEVKFSILGQSNNPIYALNPLDVSGKSQTHASGRLTSDVNGIFIIKGYRGIELGIESIVDPINRSIQFQKNKALGVFDYKSLYGSSIHKPDPVSPVIYHVWRNKSPFEPVLQLNTRYGYDIIPDTPSSIDILQNRSKAGENPKWDFAIVLQKTLPLKNDYRPFPFTLAIKALDGDIIKTDDLFLFRAPTDGYQDKITYNQSDASPGKSWEVNKKFYIRTRGKRMTVGIRFYMMVSRDSRDYNQFRIEEGYANFTGSTNLQFDESYAVNSNQSLLQRLVLPLNREADRSP